MGSRGGGERELAEEEGGLKVGRIVTEQMSERGRFEGGKGVRWRLGVVKRKINGEVNGSREIVESRRQLRRENISH